MNEIWRETFNLWSETYEYLKRINEVKSIIKQALKISINPYVAYSGGKDSLIMLHLILHEKKDISVWHWDYGDTLMPREIEKEILDNAKEIGADEVVIRKRGDSKHAREDYKFGYAHFFVSLSDVKRERGWDLGFIGIRQEESLKRRRQYKKTFIDQNCYPLLNLTWKDIWAYIITNNLPYPSVYDKYAEILGYDKVRLVTFFDMEFEKFGSLYIDGVLMPEFKHLRSKKF